MPPHSAVLTRRRLTQIVLAGFATCLLVSAFACETRPLAKPHDTPPQSWWERRGPVVPHDSFPSDCSECHQGEGWHSIREDFSFDHGAETGVFLGGAHGQAECLRCHNDIAPVELVASRGCRGCHEDPHRRMLGVNCQDCHTETSWSVQGEIGRHNQTRFPLVGAHAATACFRCHEGAEVGNYSQLDVECIACHQADLKAAQNPDHIAQGWVNDCDDCHTATQWAGGAFVHNSFPLVAAHAAADCEACHVGGVFAGTPFDCEACHLPEYQATTDPNHIAAGFPTDCELCHTPTTWDSSNFAHNTFPLTGQHLSSDCSDCHENGVFGGTPTDCAACHIAEYNQASDPNHIAAGFPTDCQLCHGTGGWEGSNFDHGFWPLTGDHLSVNCSDCHENNMFVGTPTDCASCHIDDYNQTNDPNHIAAGFPTTCEICHDTNGWEGANFNHSFPLVGDHNQDCSVCHTTPGNFLQFSCIDCHEHNKQDTDDDHDEVGGYIYSSPACLSCHPDGDD